jgi:hypothetical protein
MDPVTVGAVLLAIVSGAAGQAGSRLWDSAAALVRRPFGHQPAKGATEPAGSGMAEVTALEHAPHDEERAMALAQALLARGAVDSAFRHELEAWWAQARRLRLADGGVTNTISGGVQHGPVLQGRDFTSITFGARPSDGAASAK